MTAPELEHLIAQAKAEGWTELDLSGQELTSLPPVLGTLSQLQVLKLGWNKTTRQGNYLTELPEVVSQLTNLQSLDLSDNLHCAATAHH